MIKKNTKGKVLVLGLGNTIKGDDGIGIYVTQKLKKCLCPQKFDIICTDGAGFSWLDLLSGYKKVIIIDSIKSPSSQIGRVSKLTSGSFKQLKHFDSSHQLGFTTVLSLGNKLGVTIPKKIKVYAIGIGSDDTFCDKFSASMQKKRENIIKLIKSLIKEE